MAGGTIRAILSIMLIFMTGNTLGWRASIDAIAMTALAIYSRVLPHQWKGSLVVIKCRVAPATGTMTGVATCPKLPIMFVVVGMASETVLGRTFVPICMTGNTLHAGMSARQREARIVVMEGHF